MIPRVSLASAIAALALAALLMTTVQAAAGGSKRRHKRHHSHPQPPSAAAGAAPHKPAGAAGVTNVHVVCHTHDDVGWLKTVDQYYLGANNSIQFAGVQYVLDSVMPALEANPARRFIYVEVAFFIRWWREQTPAMQQRVKALVANGQLEFINGGWCMNDEAATHYYDIVDQMTRGHAFLRDTFGVTPTIGWHIDPFGHSAAQAELFALMKFDAFFFGRIDYQDKNARLAARQMEMLWRPSASLGQTAQLFAGVTFNGYGPPDGFNWDVYQPDEPINDDERLEDVNIHERADAFARWVRWAATFYATPNVMLTMGSDFEYTNANTWYKNLDKLMTYMQHNASYADLNLLYSTPSTYLQYVNAAQPTLTVKTDDFFPYSDWEHAMWTGYFTSRVALKGYVRELSSYLQTCKQLEVLVPGTPSGQTSQLLIDAMAVAQHHDAVSGTSKQHVAYDYAKRLSRGQTACATVVGEAVATLADTTGAGATTPFAICPLLNVSVCAPLSSAPDGQFVPLVLYNNLGKARSEHVRLPWYRAYAPAVVDGAGNAVAAQLTPNADAGTGASAWLTFEARVPAFGFNTYFVDYASNASPDDADATTTTADGLARVPTGKPAADGAAEASEPATGASSDDEAGAGVSALENEYLRIEFHGAYLASVTNKQTGVSVNVNQSVQWYTPSKGTAQDSQASGAYIFRPAGDAATPNPLPAATLSIVTGSLVQEATQTFGPWATQIVRLYADRAHFEVEYTIGPIDISDNIGKEVITRWETDWPCGSTFWTDSNGREMQKRVVNFRPTWPLQVFEPVAGNYYPMNSAAKLVNSAGTGALLFLNDRSQGVGGVQDGELEIMLHRRLLADDSRGVGEPLNEPGTDGRGLVVRTRHFVVLDTPDRVGTAHRLLAEAIANPFNAMFAAPTASGPSGWASTHRANWTALAADLPPAIHLQTVQALPNGNVILRVEHMFEANESSTYSAPVTVDLEQTFFGPLKKSSAIEYSLSANQPIGGAGTAAAEPRYHWKTEDTAQSEINLIDERPAPPPSAGPNAVTLYPMQIRTFVLA